MTIKQQLVEEISKVTKSLGLDIEPKVEYPADSKHGDYSTNVALVAAKQLKRNPIELGEEIVEELRSKNQELRIFEKIEVVKPGFINFWITQEFLVQKAQNSTEISKIGKGKKVIVEYSSPNIAKPFTIGHLRSTIIGDAIANLLETTGHEVYRDSHVGDWGTQFGKQIYAIKEWGNEEEISKSDRPVKLLVELYVRFHQEAEKNPELEDKARAWFKKLENRDAEAKELWKKCIDWSWKEFDAIYDELGVPSQQGAEFENNGRGYGESFFEDKMDVIIEELEKKGLLKIGKEGAKIVEFDEATKLPPLMILKKDGATLYATRDLATDKFRLEKYGSDILVINEVGVEQSLYFQQLYELEHMLGWYKKDQRVNVKHGLIRFKDGKMSTRKGNTIWLEDVLDEAESRAFRLMKREFPDTDGAFGTEDIKINKKSESAKEHKMNTGEIFKISKQVGIGAIKWNDLKRDAKQDIMFDWDDVLNMQGNSGPYLQYVYARTQSLLAKSEGKDLRLNLPAGEAGIKDLRLEPEERDLLRLLSKSDEVIVEAAERLSPHIVANYLFELAQAFNLFYQRHLILKAEEDTRDFRLSLTNSTGETIKKGLYLLGIEAPSKM
ncbi:MAG TPA: arginine--tRNA ligase [Xanthomonadales bacterium]|nr:arginine--tRNA ligase [Xanthomonadales bacterium]